VAVLSGVDVGNGVNVSVGSGVNVGSRVLVGMGVDVGAASPGMLPQAAIRNIDMQKAINRNRFMESLSLLYFSAFHFQTSLNRTVNFVQPQFTNVTSLLL
jgi:tetrahydrodipicolinate N-succinyltransferase